MGQTQKDAQNMVIILWMSLSFRDLFAIFFKQGFKSWKFSPSKYAINLHFLALDASPAKLGKNCRIVL